MVRSAGIWWTPMITTCKLPFVVLAILQDSISPHILTHIQRSYQQWGKLTLFFFMLWSCIKNIKIGTVPTSLPHSSLGMLCSNLHGGPTPFATCLTRVSASQTGCWKVVQLAMVSRSQRTTTTSTGELIWHLHWHITSLTVTFTGQPQWWAWWAFPPFASFMRYSMSPVLPGTNMSHWGKRTTDLHQRQKRLLVERWTLMGGSHFSEYLSYRESFYKWQMAKWFVIWRH